MDVTETIDNNQFNEGLEFNERIKGYLLETAKWAKFLSIVGFVGIGLMFIGAIFIIVMGSSIGFRGGQTLFVGLLYLGMIALYFFPIYYLYLFAIKMKSGVNTNTQEGINLGFENLKSHYKFLGIMMIIVLSFYGLILLIALLAQLA